MNSQELQQKQQANLTPQQIMLMRMLQLPIDTLEQSIKEEIEKNPMLEETDTATPKEETLDTNDNNDDRYDDDDDDDNYREHLQRDKNTEYRDPVFVAETSVAERLLEQLSFKPLSTRQKSIGQEIIGNIDENGYLCRDLGFVSNELAFRQGIDTSIDEIEEVLHIVQTLEPAGIGARTLQECLSLQLHRDNDGTTAMKDAINIVDHHFDLFAKRNFDKLQQHSGMNADALEAAIGIIKRMNPKPGPGINESNRHPLYVVPDFIISQHNGRLTLVQNDSMLPSLRLNSEYQTLMDTLNTNSRRTHNEQETLRFLKEKTEDANLFMEALQLRHRTLHKIVSYIVAHQADFLISGDINDLKPLQQKDVAEATGFDTSTISRVVNSKHLQTDFGTIPLSDCFSKALASDEGEAVATKRIKALMQQMVDNEDKADPLTDEALKEQLNTMGYPVARRTVAKYREMLGIPVGRLRREFKSLIILLLPLTLFLSNPLSGTPLHAQQPSYYDSLINAQLQKKSPQQKKQHDKKNVRQHTDIDTALMNGDELLDHIYDNTIPDCARLWYGNHFSPNRVRECILTLDSLPDEVNIRLIKKEDEFCFPVKNIITSPYGWRWERAHRGVDIRLNIGTPVHCAFAGVVRVARPMGAYGNLVVIRHYNGLETVYGHLSKINVKLQQVVAAGTVIGLGGSTGHSTGPHLHFEVRFEYETFDPEWILDFKNYTLRTRRLHLDKSYFGVTKPRGKNTVSYKADKSYIKEKEATQKKPRYYTAQKDDYTELVALKFGLTVEQLRALNPEMGKVKKGMRIRVR